MDVGPSRRSVGLPGKGMFLESVTLPDHTPPPFPVDAIERALAWAGSQAAELRIKIALHQSRLRNLEGDIIALRNEQEEARSSSDAKRKSRED